MGCPTYYDPTASCQCERTCELQGNCCWDYDRCGSPGIINPRAVDNSSVNLDAKSNVALPAARNDTVHSKVFFNDESSCTVMGCPSYYDPTASCQCERTCELQGNCCWDYERCGSPGIINPRAVGNSSQDLAENSNAVFLVAKETKNDTVHSKVFFNDRNSCATMGCPKYYDPSASCQCEGSCLLQGNCCWDYERCGNGGIIRPLGHEAANFSSHLHTSQFKTQLNSTAVIYP